VDILVSLVGLNYWSNPVKNINQIKSNHITSPTVEAEIEDSLILACWEMPEWHSRP
jgi:hypothetical protein